MSETVGDLGEFGLIAAFREMLGQGPDIELGPGDDAAIVRAPDGRMLVSTDVLVEGNHFRRDWSEPYDIGRKAAAQNLADVAAMGGHPTALVVGLCIPRDLPAEFALRLVEGLRDECEGAGASIAGGDVTRSETVIVSVTVLGSLRGGRAVTRDGARPGDVVAVCGRLGWSAAGQEVLSRGFRSPKVLVEAHRRPAPPYDAGPEAAGLGATAMIDVSDGLLADLAHIARASGVEIDIDPAAFEIPEPFRAVAAATGTDPLAYALTGGEDHALVAAFPGDAALPERWRVIGTVQVAGDDGPRVLVDHAEYVGEAGHAHF